MSPVVMGGIWIAIQLLLMITVARFARIGAKEMAAADGQHWLVHFFLNTWWWKVKSEAGKRAVRNALITVALGIGAQFVFMIVVGFFDLGRP